VEDTAEMMEELHRHQHFVQAGALSAAALLLIGTIARIRLSDTPLDRRKGATSTPKKKNGQSLLSTVRSFVSRTLSIALPFYASVQLGGVRVALVLLVTIASGLTNTGVNAKASMLNRLHARKEVVLFLVVLLGVDMIGLLGNYAILDLMLGYLALLTSAFAISPPIPYLDRLLGRHMPILTSPTPTSSAGPTPPSTPRWPSGSPRKDTQPSKIADANTSIAAGTTLAIVTALSSYSLAIPLQLSPIHFSFSVLAMIAMSGLTFFALPVTIGSKGKPGLGVGLAVTAIFAYIQSHQSFGFTMIPLLFAVFCIAGYFVALQFSAPDFGHFKETNRTKNGETHSIFTAYLLSYCAPGSMLDTILGEKDSRRIAYFAW
jgi:zinc transporter 5/7